MQHRLLWRGFTKKMKLLAHNIVLRDVGLACAQVKRQQAALGSTTDEVGAAGFFTHVFKAPLAEGKMRPAFFLLAATASPLVLSFR